ncbi:uncharacterized protein LOC144660941 [Oculina patagonica]
MEFLEANIETIRDLVKENKTHKQISKILLEAFPEVKRGFSERNIRLFCANHGIKRLSEAQVDYIVAECVREVGPSFGRKMMTGYVRSKELKLTNNQVMKSLRRVNPVNHARRRDDTVRRRNPVPYYAPYYGNKLHCDQNEKLAMYGCTLFALSDGCSSKVVKLFSMPKKNAVVIYSHFSSNKLYFVLIN